MNICHKIKYKRIWREDLKEVSDLHGEYFSFRSSPQLLDWQFFNTNLPAPGVIVGAFDKGRLVGTQAFIPIEAQCKK